MRTQKQILRKIDAWKNDPMMVSGVYRLFTYIPFESIPEEYHSHFPEEAREKWNDDLNQYTRAHLYLDVEAQMNAFLKIISKKNIVHCIGLIPMMLADLYMADISANKLQARLSKLKREYQEEVAINRVTAEQVAIYEMLDILLEIKRLLKLELSFDIEGAMERIIKLTDTKDQTMITPSINKAVDKALEEYKEKEKEVDQQDG